MPETPSRPIPAAAAALVTAVAVRRPPEIVWREEEREESKPCHAMPSCMLHGKCIIQSVWTTVDGSGGGGIALASPNGGAAAYACTFVRGEFL